MPRYSFQLRTASHVATALQVEQDDLTALRVEMARFAGEVLRDHAAQIRFDQDWQVDVTDETGLILFVLHISAQKTAATM